ncbi:hypothetical protein SDC9_147743 [bioreactor metagenome]|uniref:Uncharacterized protein n=1 Tax=bioreactor metagenome TaxID=1076179 RepID=A0A645EFJ0_9ZZZZ
MGIFHRPKPKVCSFECIGKPVVLYLCTPLHKKLVCIKKVELYHTLFEPCCPSLNQNGIQAGSGYLHTGNMHLVVHQHGCGAIDACKTEIVHAPAIRREGCILLSIDHHGKDSLPLIAHFHGTGQVGAFMVGYSLPVPVELCFVCYAFKAKGKPLILFQINATAPSVREGEAVLPFLVIGGNKLVWRMRKLNLLPQ